MILLLRDYRLFFFKVSGQKLDNLRSLQLVLISLRKEYIVGQCVRVLLCISVTLLFRSVLEQMNLVFGDLLGMMGDFLSLGTRIRVLYVITPLAPLVAFTIRLHVISRVAYEL